MKSEQEIQEKINRLEQLAERHQENGDWDSKLDVMNSIQLLRWVLDKDPKLNSEREEKWWDATRD